MSLSDSKTWSFRDFQIELSAKFVSTTRFDPQNPFRIDMIIIAQLVNIIDHFSNDSLTEYHDMLVTNLQYAVIE